MLEPRSEGTGVCLATATTEAFVPGTFVLVASFLEHHPRFGGDVVVFNDGLSPGAQTALKSLGQVRLEPVSPVLRRRSAKLIASVPQLFLPVSRLPRLFSLEAFRLKRYRKVLFCDSDLLFQGPVDEVFDRSELLLCCPDHASLHGQGRDARTFAPTPVDAPDAILDTFNAGFMLIDRCLADGACYSGLLDMIVPGTWDGVHMGEPTTDQLLLNRYFAGRQTLLTPTYNYLMSSAADIYAIHDLEPTSAKALHFNIGTKPWMVAAMLAGVGDPRQMPDALLRHWYDAWMRSLGRTPGAAPSTRPIALGRGPQSKSGRQAVQRPPRVQTEGHAQDRRDVCLATAMTDEFLPGTFVLLASFLKHHPGFKGDIVVFNDGLSASARSALGVFGQVRTEPISPALRERLAKLAAAVPQMLSPLNQLPRLWSLEAFRLEGYRKVLFCDSDLLFQGAVDSLFDRTEPLLCCPDRASLHGQGRDARTTVPTSADAPDAMLDTFNAGFMLIDRQLTDGGCYSDLLGMIAPKAWEGARSRLTDQLLLNRYFAGRKSLLPPTYNCLVRSLGIARDAHGLGPKSAKVLHFVGPDKPWRIEEVLAHAAERSAATGHPEAEAYGRWYAAWVDGMVATDVRSAVRRAVPAGHRLQRHADRMASTPAKTPG